MHAVRPAGSGSRDQLETQLEMAVFEEAAAAALASEEAQKLDDSALAQRHTENTAPSTPDVAAVDAALLSRAAETSTPHSADGAETISAIIADTLAQCGDDFNSLLNQNIRTQIFLYHPDKPTDFSLKLAQLFNILGFPTAQLFEKYTINQLLQSVYFINLNPTMQVLEIHIREFTSEENAQFIQEVQAIYAINQIRITNEQIQVLTAAYINLLLSLQTTQETPNLHQKYIANEEALLVQALQAKLDPTASAPAQPEHAASQS